MKPAFRKGKEICHRNTGRARSPAPSVIGFIYCFDILREKDGKCGRRGVGRWAPLRAAAFSSAAAMAPPPSSQGRNLPSSAKIISLDRVLTALGQESRGKKKKKKTPKKQKQNNLPPPSINKSEPKAPGGEFLSPMMGQRPGPTRRGPHPKGPHPQEPGPALKFPRRSHLLHKGCLGQPSKASRRFPRGSVFSDSQARAAGGTQSPEAQGAHALGLMPRRQLIVSSQVCQWLLSPGMSPLPTRPVFSALRKTM